MDAPDVVNLALTAHGAVALLVLGAGLPRYAERADVHGKAMQETEDLLSKVGQRVTSHLEEVLNDFLRDSASTTPSLIVRSTGEASEATYSEKPSTLVGSDRFRECIRTFMLSNARSIADYREIVDAHRNWCRWSQGRRWGVFAFAVWELLCLFGLGVAGKIGGISFSPSATLWSFSGTTAMTLWFLLSEYMLIRQQSVIDAQRERYYDV